MNQPQNPNQKFLQLMLRAQYLARHDARSERGYAMVVVSIISIFMFSLLAAYMTLSNLSRSATAAYTKSNSTFYVAESGLNARAQLIRQKVGSYALPTGTSATSINQCWNADATSALQYNQTSGTNDFGCKNYSFVSATGTAEDRVVGGEGSTSVTRVQNPDTYIATTYVVNNPNNLTTYPKQTAIPTGELFAGMRMLEYTHRVYSSARTQTAGTLSPPEQTVLQLDFQTRFVPLFQFAAFFEQDLELNPGPRMNINGRVHSNNNLYLAANSGPLCIAGQISARLKIYNRRKFNESGTTVNGNAYLYPNSGSCTGTVTDATKKLDNKVPDDTTDRDASDPDNYDSTNRPNMIARFGTNVQDLVANIKTPPSDFLAKTDSSGNLSTYYTKADLRIEMKSNPAPSAIPFNVTSLATDMGTSTCATSFDVAVDRVGAATLTCTKFQAGQLHSLRQPVLVQTGKSTDDDRLCTAELAIAGAAPTSTEIGKLTTTEKAKVVRALQTAIVAQSTLINYGHITTGKKPSDFPEISTLFGNYLDTTGLITSLTSAELTTLKTTLNDSRLDKIAALSGDCFKPAPIQKYTDFYSNRESKSITMLQTNIESLTIWNRDGLYVDLTADTSGDPVLDGTGKYQVTSHNGGQGNSADQLIFRRAAIPASVTTCNATDNLCKGSFRHLGLATSDSSEGGLVFHMRVDANKSPGTDSDYTARQSPYGFAITNGIQLPGPLTIATDQAAYLQGDYNFWAGTGNAVNGVNSVTSASQAGTVLSNTTIGNGGYKFPASILADSVSITSRNCLDTTFRKLNCGQPENAQPNAIATTVNVAVLGGHDINPVTTGTQYSGGLHNYPRLHENWRPGGTAVALNYRGSFVSVGAPLQVSGLFSTSYYTPPIRNWDYDMDFNDVANLPPLTPNIVYIKQNVFIRGYRSN